MTFFEVKRQSSESDLKLLKEKTMLFKEATGMYGEYEEECKGLSIEEITDMVYMNIFKENAKEYRKILRLEKSENVRRTMYSKVLDIISSYEAGFDEELHKAYERKGSKLTAWEDDALFAEFESQRLWELFGEQNAGAVCHRPEYQHGTDSSGERLWLLAREQQSGGFYKVCG